MCQGNADGTECGGRVAFGECASCFLSMHERTRTRTHTHTDRELCQAKEETRAAVFFIVTSLTEVSHHRWDPFCLEGKRQSTDNAKAWGSRLNQHF